MFRLGNKEVFPVDFEFGPLMPLNLVAKNTVRMKMEQMN